MHFVQTESVLQTKYQSELAKNQFSVALDLKIYRVIIYIQKLIIQAHETIIRVHDIIICAHDIIIRL